MKQQQLALDLIDYVKISPVFAFNGQDSSRVCMELAIAIVMIGLRIPSCQLQTKRVLSSDVWVARMAALRSQDG